MRRNCPTIDYGSICHVFAIWYYLGSETLLYLIVGPNKGKRPTRFNFPLPAPPRPPAHKLICLFIFSIPLLKMHFHVIRSAVEKICSAATHRQNPAISVADSHMFASALICNCCETPGFSIQGNAVFRVWIRAGVLIASAPKCESAKDKRKIGLVLFHNEKYTG